MNEATIAAVAAKKDQAKNKRAKDTTALVTTGSEILQRLEQLGHGELLRLKIDELLALLVNVAGNLLTSINSHNKRYERAEGHATPII